MNQTCIKIFSFCPEDYNSMADYLNEMLQKGWRLRWCKGVLAGFERTEHKNLHYIVDPYPMTSVFNLKKFPKYRLNEYMENGWYAVGKSKGCYIFCSDDPNPEIPALEEGIRESVQKTRYLGSLTVAALLLVLLIQAFRTPAVLYCILLTDVYLVLTGLVFFFIGYHILNAALLLKAKTHTTQRKGCKQYVVHDAMIFVFFLLGILLQARHQSSMLHYLLLPILVVAIGSTALFLVAKRAKTAQESNKRLIPIVCIIGLSLFITIPFSVQRLQENSREEQKNKAATLLAEKDAIPVAHLQDFIAAPDVKNAMKENSSILGNNILYAEESENLAIFTNFTEMKSAVLAKPIFHYLFNQIQKERNENFQEKTYHGITYYSLENANTILYQSNHVVYLCTAPSSVSNEQVLTLLLSYSLT